VLPAVVAYYTKAVGGCSASFASHFEKTRQSTLNAQQLLAIHQSGLLARRPPQSQGMPHTATASRGSVGSWFGYNNRKSQREVRKSEVCFKLLLPKSAWPKLLAPAPPPEVACSLSVSIATGRATEHRRRRRAPSSELLAACWCSILSSSQVASVPVARASQVVLEAQGSRLRGFSLRVACAALRVTSQASMISGNWPGRP
jgi:hypothetical protein